jgi:hypothetical protein
MPTALVQIPGDAYATPSCPTCGGKGYVPRENPCPGHKTKKEAEEHYRQYLVENAVEGEVSGAMYPCRVCGTFTKGYFQVDGGELVMLCDGHRRRQELDRLVEAPTEIISSY